jgi:hypothetical protein
MIGHMKVDGRLGRNHLLGAAGDAMNALLVAAGHNLADPELDQALCGLAYGSSDQLISATGYFSSHLKSNASPVPTHYSGPTRLELLEQEGSGAYRRSVARRGRVPFAHLLRRDPSESAREHGR